MTPHKSQDKTPETGSQIDAKAGPGADVTPKAEKSRSRSRKRASIFGKVLGKKEEADEPKDLKREEKETKKEERREEKAIEKTEKAEERKEAEGQQKTADEEKKIEKAEKEETKKTPEVAPVAGAGELINAVGRGGNADFTTQAQVGLLMRTLRLPKQSQRRRPPQRTLRP